jgi:hypothetical protein
MSNVSSIEIRTVLNVFSGYLMTLGLIVTLYILYENIHWSYHYAVSYSYPHVVIYTGCDGWHFQYEIFQW